MTDLLDMGAIFGTHFWQVFCFWACWQICDWVLAKLKVKLRKPWIFDHKPPAGPRNDGDDFIP